MPVNALKKPVDMFNPLKPAGRPEYGGGEPHPAGFLESTMSAAMSAAVSTFSDPASRAARKRRLKIKPMGWPQARWAQETLDAASDGAQPSAPRLESDADFLPAPSAAYAVSAGGWEEATYQAEFAGEAFSLSAVPLAVAPEPSPATPACGTVDAETAPCPDSVKDDAGPADRTEVEPAGVAAEPAPAPVMPDLDSTSADVAESESAAPSDAVTLARKPVKRPVTPAKALARAAAAGDLDAMRSLLAADPALAKGWEPIAAAAAAGDVRAVAALLEAGADPNAQSPDRHRCRPLHRAIEPRKVGGKVVARTAGHVETVKALLAEGAKVSTRATAHQVTPVALAAMTGQKQFLPHLLSFLDAWDVFTAAVVGKADVMNMLLKRDPSKARAVDANGMTPLHYCAASRVGQDDPAAAERLRRTAELLLNAGGDVNALAKDEELGLTEPTPPVVWAAGNRGVLEVLLGRGADAALVLLPALRGGDYGAAAFLVGRGVDLSGPTLAPLAAEFAKAGQCDPCRWLVAHGAPVNAATPDGRTPLHHACRRGASAEFVAFLLDRGADPTARDAGGETPMALALRRGKGQVIDLLRERGAE